MNWRAAGRAALPLTMLALSLAEFHLQRRAYWVGQFEGALLSFQGTWLLCLVIWCSSLIYLTAQISDWPLIGFLLSVVGFSLFAGYPVPNALLTLGGVALCKGLRLFLTGEAASLAFLSGSAALVAISSLYHWDIPDNFYTGSRWTGLWDNPNTYGTLMGAGATLAIALLALNLKRKAQSPRLEGMRKLKIIFLSLVGLTTGLGLVMSYSRGAWLATAVALLFLAWCYGRLKWRRVCLCVALGALGILFFWGRTPDTAPWYVKRADLGRPSVQHRLAAWKAGLEMMRDHPFGVGWDNALKIYGESYHHPEAGAAALATNDYMMIGTELGIPALLCFVGYSALCLRGKPKTQNEAGGIQAACRAGAIVFIASFWCDGGLFKLPTAVLFWILLELGTAKGGKNERQGLIIDSDHGK